MEGIAKIDFAASHYIKSTDPLLILRSPVLWGIAGIWLGVSLFFRGFPLLKRKRLIENTPTSTVRGASLGAVEVSGKVVGPYTLISPLSELDCFYYHAVARGCSGEDDRNTEVREETLYTPFFLDDGTGRMMVDPRGAEMALPPSAEEDYSPSTSIGLTRHFLDRHGLSSSDPAHLEEYCIREGDQLFVLGTLRENPSTVEASGRSSPEGPGFLSFAAADLQRRAALASIYPNGNALPPAAKKKVLEAESFDLNPPVLLMKGVSGEPFLISRSSQRDLVGGLASRSILYIWGGPILALFGLWLLLGRLLLP
jgi:E3 Ubiquitin ligase